MIINVSSVATTDSAILYPITANGHYSSALKAIASQVSMPEDVLIRDFKAEHGEQRCLYGANGQQLFLLGLGERASFQDVLKAARSFAHKQKSKLGARLCVSFLAKNTLSDMASACEAVANGLLLGTYQIGRFKSESTEAHPFDEKEATLTFALDEADTAGILLAAERGQAMAATQQSIMDLINAPSNKKQPVMLAEWALASGKQYGYDVKVLDKPAIEALGLHALLAVNQGSNRPPAFIVMEYRPTESTGTLSKVGLVGKGITFDTGGLSIKPSTNMHYMKSDMGGAAAVFGAMEMAAKQQLPIHLIGIVPTTENSVGSAAIKPGDVIDSYSGKTIEIIDTDAEGRLILSDGIAYMQRHFQPDILIDLATLTGSAVRTFGYHAGALFSNDETLQNQLMQAGQRVGERVWPLPLWDDY
ncbi:MAG: leucyl aminopeptidase family protein, partial [Bacteroidota bacterium]